MSTQLAEETLAAVREGYDLFLRKQAVCQHRWEQTFFGQKYWQPGTWQYRCRRCGKCNMITLESK